MPQKIKEKTQVCVYVPINGFNALYNVYVFCEGRHSHSDGYISIHPETWNLK